ncbi:hypothetical protein CRG98_003881 [Punica granatum]|uniref:Uncharacterized protein n=1 Tax=Punica granatum TaxID=22663 RepID=A0A2I0L4W8_PUNGR|nr:hypothetical protein CRG98_003881 [Punica granatum]
MAAASHSLPKVAPPLKRSNQFSHEAELLLAVSRVESGPLLTYWILGQSWDDLHLPANLPIQFSPILWLLVFNLPATSLSDSILSHHDKDHDSYRFDLPLASSNQFFMACLLLLIMNRLALLSTVTSLTD